VSDMLDTSLRLSYTNQPTHPLANTPTVVEMLSGLQVARIWIYVRQIQTVQQEWILWTVTLLRYVLQK